MHAALRARYQWCCRIRMQTWPTHEKNTSPGCFPNEALTGVLCAGGYEEERESLKGQEGQGRRKRQGWGCWRIKGRP